MLVWKCASCGTQMSASEADAGKEFKCTSCAAATVAPAPRITPPPIPPTYQSAYQATPPFMVGAQPGMRPAKCSRIVFIFLAFFLGGLGVHNFVAGHTNRGIWQLAITVGSFILAPCTLGISLLAYAGVHIWALVEIVTTTTDSNGVPMP